jgi:hypothetical protein
MTKRSRYEQAQRAAEDERTRETAERWLARLTPAEISRYNESVAIAHARPPAGPPVNMAPGTRPNPPRPGREPREVEEQPRSRR